MSDPAREWGPDSNGRWGNKMMEYRNMTADELVRILRTAEELERDIRSGEVTRTRQLTALKDIKEFVFLGLLLLQAAGAPIDPVALRNGTKRGQE